MGRVEKRLYKRKRQRRKCIRQMVFLLLVTAAVLVAWGRMPDHFSAEWIGTPTATPIASAFDRTKQSREIILEEENWYAIQTGVFSTEAAAVQKADAYAQRGAPGTVIQEGEKWRVFIACYKTAEEAAAVRTRLEEKQQVETYLYTWTCPE